jgi:hypothetical protein
LCLVSTIHKIFKFWDIHCGIGGNWLYDHDSLRKMKVMGGN